MIARLRPLALASAGVLLLHWLLARTLAHVDFMQALAAARHGHVGASLALALLLLARLVALVLLPALAAAKLGVLAVSIGERVSSRRCAPANAPPSDPPPRPTRP